MASRRDRDEPMNVRPRVLIARRQHAALYLSLAALALCLRAITLVMPPDLAVSRKVRDAITADARRLGLQIDAALIRAAERARGLASSPVLQAGVLTDAATLADLVETELDIPIGPGEALELYQARGSAVTSLVRLPADAPPLARVPGLRARLADRGGLAVIAGAEVVPYTKQVDLVGELAVAVDVDLSTLGLRRTTRAARLVGAGDPIDIVPARSTGGPTFTVAVPQQLGALSLQTIPVLEPTHAAWLLPVRYAALALAFVFLTAFAVALRGTRRRAARGV